MAKPMLNQQPLSSPMVARVFIAILMLPMAATASHADNADQIAISRDGAQGTRQYPARTNRPFVHEARSSNECVGGYRWRIQEINYNLTDDQQSVPLPC